MVNLAQVYLIISPEKFHILKFILEAYDNLGILSSHQSDKGIVLLRYSAGCTTEIMELLSYLAPYLKAFKFQNIP